MQSIKVYPAGFELTHLVPESEAEYNALAPKRPNAMLEDAVANVEYRGVFPEFRDKLAAAVAKETGIARKTKKVGEKEVFDETEGKYLARAQAELGLSDEDFVARFASLAQGILDGIKFDPSVREAKSDGPAIGKNDLKIAQELISRGPGKVTEVAAMLSQKLGRAVAEDEKSLARALADWRRAKAKELEAAQKAEMGL